MDFSQDYFALFGLPRRHALDLTELEQRYREIQTQVHPDKHVNLSDAERRLAMQWSTQVNEAYQTLRQPMRRARYLLHLVGFDVATESNTAMPTDFLLQQMEWREALGEVKNAADYPALEQMHIRMKQEMARQYQQLEIHLDVVPNYSVAAGTVRQMMFQEKLLHEIDEALAASET